MQDRRCHGPGRALPDLVGRSARINLGSQRGSRAGVVGRAGRGHPCPQRARSVPPTSADGSMTHLSPGRLSNSFGPIRFSFTPGSRSRRSNRVSPCKLRELRVSVLKIQKNNPPRSRQRSADCAFVNLLFAFQIVHNPRRGSGPSRAQHRPGLFAGCDVPIFQRRPNG